MQRPEIPDFYYINLSPSHPSSSSSLAWSAIKDHGDNNHSHCYNSCKSTLIDKMNSNTDSVHVD